MSGDLQDAQMEKDILAQKQQDLEAIIESEGSEATSTPAV